MKKSLLTILVACFMATSLVACGSSTTANQETNTSETTTDENGAKTDAEKVDFSQNENVDRASEYAKTEIALPISGIGAKVSTDIKAKEKYRILIMTKNSTNPYMVGMWKGGEKAAQDMGVEVISLAPGQQDSIEEQISIIESMVQQDIDGMIIHPSDSKGIMPAVEKANAAGIPVVAIGTAPTRGAFMRTGVDYYETGYIVAKELFEEAGGKGGVIVLEGPPGAQNAEDRKAGIQDALKEYPEMELISSQTANFKRAEAMQVMENLLQTEGTKDKLKVVIGCNDEMAIGSIQALKAANLQDVLVGGFDGSQDASTAIKDGDLTVTYNTDPIGSTYLGIAYIVEYLNNGTLPEEYFIPFPSKRFDPLITKANIEEYSTASAWWIEE